MSTSKWVERLTRNLSEVLDDRDALEAFRGWAAKEESRCASAIELHFAIKQFRNVMISKPVDGPSIAVLSHKKFISMKTGTCSFLPDSVRSQMSQRAHSIKNAPPSRDFFEPVIGPLNDHLKRIHASFVCSDAFSMLAKRINAMGDGETKPSTSTATPTTIKKERASTTSSASPSTSHKGGIVPPSSFPFNTVSRLAAATISSGFNPFRTYNIDGIKQEPIDVDSAIASKQRASSNAAAAAASAAGEDFTDKLEGKLKKLADAMEKKGVEFARDLDSNFSDLTDEAIDRDIDDYADRMDARGKSGMSKRSTSRSPPSLPLTSPPLAPPPLYSAYGMNGFAPPPTNRLRRKYMETAHNTTEASSGYSMPPQASPTAGTINKKGRPSIDLDSSSSGYYSNRPSSSSSAFSSHFSAPHFSTLRRPSHGGDMGHHHPHPSLSSPGQFPTLARPSYVPDHHSPYAAAAAAAAASSAPSPFMSLLTPGASPSHHERANDRLHNGFATLPRSTGRIHSAPGSSTSSGKPDGKILLRVTVVGSRPMVFRTEPDEGGMMTLKKFRTIFGIGKEKNKFFFKNYSEEDPSDYQWDLVSDDSATVPLYHGSITAECRPALDSPE